MEIFYRKIGEDEQYLKYRLDKKRTIIVVALTSALVGGWLVILWLGAAGVFSDGPWRTFMPALLFSSAMAVLVFYFSSTFVEGALRECRRARRQKKKVVIPDLGNVFWGPFEIWVEK